MMLWNSVLLYHEALFVTEHFHSSDKIELFFSSK